MNCATSSRFARNLFGIPCIIKVKGMAGRMRITTGTFCRKWEQPFPPFPQHSCGAPAGDRSRPRRTVPGAGPRPSDADVMDFGDTNCSSKLAAADRRSISCTPEESQSIVRSSYRVRPLGHRTHLKSFRLKQRLPPVWIPRYRPITSRERDGRVTSA